MTLPGAVVAECAENDAMRKPREARPRRAAVREPPDDDQEVVLEALGECAAHVYIMLSSSPGKKGVRNSYNTHSAEVHYTTGLWLMAAEGPQRAMA